MYFLPKKYGWPIMALLVFWDAFLTHARGREGNPLWRPFIEKYGIDFLWVLAPIGLLIFFLGVNFFGYLAEKIDKIPEGREITLTALVLVYGIYNVYITFFLPRFGFFGSRSHYAIIPLLLVVGFMYTIYVEYARRKAK